MGFIFSSFNGFLDIDFDIWLFNQSSIEFLELLK